MSTGQNKLSRPDFFKVCKAVETEYAELKDCSSQPKLAAKISQMLGFQVPVSSVMDAIAATGLTFTFPKKYGGKPAKPSSKSWRFIRNLTRHLVCLYKELGVQVPETLELQLRKMAQDELAAEPQQAQPATPMAFITGSHAYGTPNIASDIDLVIRLSEADYQILVAIADKIAYDNDEYAKNPQNRIIRIGKLNLLVCLSDAQYQMWLRGTRELKRKRPVTRKTACDLFAKLRLELAKKEHG